MKKNASYVLTSLGTVIALSLGSLLFAQEAPPPPTVPAEPPQAAVPAPPALSEPSALEAPDAPAKKAVEKPAKQRAKRSERQSRQSNQVIRFFSDAVLEAGKTADQVIAIGGSVQTDGPADQTVSILGSNTVNATVDQAVAIGGNAYVNSRVRGQVVAVGGSVILGPEARVDGEVIAVGGSVKRDPTAEIAGDTVEVAAFENMTGLHAWFSHALAKGRVLAFAPGLAWAWVIAGVFLACYLVTTLLFPKAVTAGAEVLEQRPGGTVLAAFLTAIILPIIGLLLAVTVVGPVAWIFFSIALALVGKAAFMAWMGRRVTNPLGIAHPALAVLIGGVALALLYCVPILGILIWKLSGFIGAGMAVYAAFLAIRRRRAEREAELAAKKAAHDAANPPAPGAPPLLPETAPAAQQTAEALAPRAGFWIRAGALVIDFLMIALIASVSRIGVATLPLFAVYCALMWALRGTTIGGIVCGLKIVRPDGRPVDWATAIVRALGGFLSILPAGLGFIWIVFDDERRAWHDKIAGTAVIHAPKGQSLV